MNKSIGAIKILVVDDAPDTLELVYRKLSYRGYRVFTVGSVGEAISFFETNTVDIIITDMKMPEASGFDLIDYAKANLRDTEIIMITGYPSYQDAVNAVKAGAYEYLPKPFTTEALYAAVESVIEKQFAKKAVTGEADTSSINRYGIIGTSPAMKPVFDYIEKTAAANITVLITGESGTGKELVARAVHYFSARASAPFIPVNCGAIPEELLESELFGYVKGAFTGANETRAGFFQTADGGTIFLDEVSETSQSMQVKLLRVLQEKEFFMVGSRRLQNTDIRVIAATNKNLSELVKNEVFREDLYYRLAVVNIDIPPLREREDDVLFLTNYFLRKYSEELGKEKLQLSDGVIQSIRKYNWPGNVRELENVIHRQVVLSDSEIIDVHHLPSFMKVSPRTGFSSANMTLQELEQEHVLRVLKRADNNQTKAAEILGISRRTLNRKLKEYRDR